MPNQASQTLNGFRSVERHDICAVRRRSSAVIRLSPHTQSRPLRCRFHVPDRPFDSLRIENGTIASNLPESRNVLKKPPRRQQPGLLKNPRYGLAIVHDCQVLAGLCHNFMISTAVLDSPDADSSISWAEPLKSLTWVAAFTFASGLCIHE